MVEDKQEQVHYLSVLNVKNVFIVIVEMSIFLLESIYFKYVKCAYIYYFLLKKKHIDNKHLQIPDKLYLSCIFFSKNHNSLMH